MYRLTINDLWEIRQKAQELLNRGLSPKKEWAVRDATELILRRKKKANIAKLESIMT